MRFVRLIAGLLLLTTGLPMIFVGGLCWRLADARDPGGAFGADLDRLISDGRAVVVSDLDALLRRDAPVARLDRTALRIIARTGAEPAFVGLAPLADVERYLGATGHLRIERVRLAQGALPTTTVAAGGLPTTAVGLPGEQEFWVRQGVGVLDLTTDEIRGRRLALAVMYPDARPGLTLDLRAELRPGWLDPVTWGALAVGTILVLAGMLLLARRPRPREVVFVVEPAQLPGLAARLGVPILDNIGRVGPVTVGSGFPAGTPRPAPAVVTDRSGAGHPHPAPVPGGAVAAPLLDLGELPSGPDVWPPASPSITWPVIGPTAPVKPPPTPLTPAPGRPAPPQPAPERPGKPAPVRPGPTRPVPIEPVEPAQPVPARHGGTAQPALRPSSPGPEPESTRRAGASRRRRSTVGR
jgi:hypothetical protein